MVLSSNDFDFLQSRGAKATDSEVDRRSSLLLRFDPLSGRAVSVASPLAPTQEVAEQSVAIERSFRETGQLFGDVSAKENSVNENHSSDTQSEAANAAEMSVSLIHDSNNMDSETNTYAKNIK